MRKLGTMVIDVVWLSGPIIADPIPQPQPTVPQITDTEHEIDAVATSFPGCGAAVVAGRRFRIER